MAHSHVSDLLYSLNSSTVTQHRTQKPAAISVVEVSTKMISSFFKDQPAMAHA